MGYEQDPFLSHEQQRQHDYSGEDRGAVKGFGFHVQSLGLLVLLPWSVFVSTFCSLTFLYHRSHLVVWSFIFLVAVFSIMFVAISSRNRRGPIYLFLGCLCTFSLMTAIAAGLLNYYEYGIKYWTIEEGRMYSNVRPDESAMGHIDAGRISFSPDARLDTQRSVGYKSHGTVYCVAPIVGDQDPASVQYFAVGEDCCSQRGDFNCDAAWDPKARSGVVVITKGPFGDSKKKWYSKAAEEAGGAYDFATAKTPLFVQWVADPDAVQDEYWDRCLMFAVCACLLHFVASALLGFVLHFMSGKRRPS